MATGEATGEAPLRAGRVVMCGAHAWVPPEVLHGGVTCLASADENWNIAVRHGRVIEWDTKKVIHRGFPDEHQGKIVAVTAGGPDFAAALSSTGKLIVWGGAGLPEMLEGTMPRAVRDGNASAIAAGPDHLVAIVAGTVYWWGDWDSGGRVRVLFPATEDEAAVEVATGQAHALVRTSQNRLVSWRKDDDDALLTPPKEVLEAKVSAVSAFKRLAMALTEDGHAYSWGVGISTQPPSEPLCISEPEVSAIAAGHYAFLGKADPPLFLAGDRPGGEPSDVNTVFPGDSVVTGKPYVLNKVSFGTPVLRLAAGGSSPTVLALAPATDAEVTLQEAYAFPTKVRPGSDLGFQWRVDNDGPAKATGIQVTVHLPSQVTLHPKHQDAVHKGTITDLGRGSYRFNTAELETQEDGWTFPLMTKVAAGATGKITATADVTAGNISDPAPSLSVSSDVTADGDRWDSSDDSDLWKLIGGAVAGGLFALFSFFGLPGGGSSSHPSSNNKPKRNKKQKNKLTTIQLDASADVPKPAAGASVVMTWTLKNTGRKNEATAPSVNITVPTGLTITKTKPAKGTAKVLSERSALFRPGSLGTHKDVTVEITAKVADDPPTSVKAAGVAAADNAVPASHTLTVTPRRKAALRLPEGNATPSKVQPGRDVSFEWSLTNDGPSSARNSKLTVTVPKGLSDVAVTADGKPLTTTGENKNQLVAKMSDLKKGATVKLAVKGTASTNATSDLTTTVEITADDAGNGVRDSVTAVLQTILEVEGKIVGKVAAGAYASYLWTVRNTTDVEATDVRMSMAAPPLGQAQLEKSAPQATSTNGEVLWELRTVKGKSVKYAIASFRISPDQSNTKLGPTAATAKATNAEDASVKDKPWAVIAENATLIVRPFDYSQGPVGIGQTVDFIWTLQNEGSEATDVRITLHPPEELTGARVRLEGDVEGTVNGNTVTFARLRRNEDCKIRLTGTLNAPQPGAYSAHAEVSYQGKPVSSVACTRMAISEASLAVTAAQRNPATVDAGSSAILRWTVSRAGQGPLQSTYLAIDVPDKVGVTAVTVNGHAVPVRHGRQVAPIDPALTDPVTVEMSVEADADLDAGPVTFTATPVWREGPQKVSTAPVTVTVTRTAVVNLYPPQSNPHPAIAGRDTQLVWDVENIGPSSCSDLTLTLPAIDGCTLLSATVGTRPAVCRTTKDKADNTGPEKWVIEAGALGSGDRTQVAAKLAVAADAAIGRQSVTANLSGKNPVISSGAEGNVTVKRAAQVTATPQAPASCTVGDQVPYIWTLENDGPSVASVVFTVTVRGEKTKVTIPPEQASGAIVTTKQAATELTWTLTAPLVPREPQVLPFVAQTDTTAGQIVVTSQLTVNQEPVTQPDAFYTKVTPPPPHR